MKNILITGANGQLGSEIKTIAKNFADNNYFFTDIPELDITNKTTVFDFCKNNKITHIINCAAYTAVDLAETEIELSNLINSTAPKILAEISKQLNIKIIHISTDYVFDGTNHRPYTEIDNPNPTSQYGKSKLEGEKNILTNPDTIIIRTSWLYSSFGNNFVKTIINLTKQHDKLTIISDQVGTPTYALDLANVILEIITNKKFISGIYNFSNHGVASWYDFAFEIIKIKNLETKVIPILTKDYPTPAKRPFYSILDKSKITNTLKIKIPHWKDSIKLCLDKLK